MQLDACPVASSGEQTTAKKPLQGGYNFGNFGKLSEFINSVKFRENSGNLKFTQGK